ncbi:hypothetical protein [Azospirillum sp. TSO22-1]|uniref:hypothetical protein n=1 Tax=Azospirillum sp. TSO22-1 TaxID=716789 RepID=UPI000D61DF9E|nr:hypothetical protein [Azospirillum sp. TSO22-1]PWC52740.1 hypothetical protein TSO221_13170 [Azospirillum sp. TSO22-1]
MDVLELLSSAASFAVGPLLIIVPLLTYRWVTDTAAHWDLYGGFREDNATLAGLLLGICLVAVTPLPGQPLSFDSVFNRGGPWDFHLEAFGSLVRDRMEVAPGLLLDRLMLDDERLNLTLGLAMAAALLLGRAVFGIARQGWWHSVATIAMDLTVATMTAALTLYAVILGLWLCNRLNFWLFLVGLVMIQEYRYNMLGLFPRHRHFRLPRARLPQEIAFPTLKRRR